MTTYKAPVDSRPKDALQDADKIYSKPCNFYQRGSFGQYYEKRLFVADHPQLN